MIFELSSWRMITNLSIEVFFTIVRYHTLLLIEHYYNNKRMQ